MKTKRSQWNKHFRKAVVDSLYVHDGMSVKDIVKREDYTISESTIRNWVSRYKKMLSRNEVEILVDPHLKFIGSLTEEGYNYSYGLRMWRDQCSQLDLNKDFYLRFEEQIQGMTPGFIRGLLFDAIDMIGCDNVLNRLHIIHPKSDLLEKMIINTLKEMA